MESVSEHEAQTPEDHESQIQEEIPLQNNSYVQENHKAQDASLQHIWELNYQEAAIFMQVFTRTELCSFQWSKLQKKNYQTQ